MDGNGAWLNHSGHLAMGSRSFITPTKNPLGWNVEWNRDKFFVVVNIDLKGCKLASQVDRHLFFLGVKKGHKVVDYYYYYYYYYPTLTPGVKPLGLILVIALIGMLDLSSTLASIPNVKWAYKK
jgi:hypothetical protein